MRGLIMDMPLLITSIMKHAEKNHPAREIVSVTADQPLHRYTYGEAFQRARRLANALTKLGMQTGDRIGTLAWNDYRHLEVYYAVSCAGAVCHTVNPRLFAEQITYIVNHAEDRWIFTDVAFVPLLEKLKDALKSVEGFIVMTDAAHMPKASLPNMMCYETLLSAESGEFEWPDLGEYAASSLCYTSGTTGNPKGVLYSHRSTVLHSFAAISPDVFSLSQQDSILPVVPMFHANAWGAAYAAPMVGSKIVFPGPKMGDGETLHALMESEKVTLSLGVPTVWLALLNYLSDTGKTLTTLKRTVVGGAACPASIMEEFQEKHGVYVHHAWGMTEMSPLGTFNTLKAGMEKLPREELLNIQAKQGRGVFCVEMKIVDEENNELPWDGKSFGALKVRGPFICSDYFKLEGESDAHDADGWFGTGDVATIDPEGYMQITDRTKDVIKSGGEWISSIDLENTAVAHPAVAEAAVIGAYHPKWTERPLLVVVKQPGKEVSKQELLASFEGQVAKWWIPEDVAFVSELPHTATGKLNKVALREEFKDYRFPD